VLASLAFLLGEQSRSFELVISDGMDHAGDVFVDTLLGLDQLMLRIARARAAGHWNCGNGFRSQPGARGSADQAGNFRKSKTNVPSSPLGAAFGGRLFKHPHHLFSELIPMAARVE